MVEVAAYAPSLAAVEAAHSYRPSVTKMATAHGERPSYRDDAVTATHFQNAAMQRMDFLNQIRANVRAEALVDVTLAGVAAAESTLEAMQNLAVRLQDTSLTDNDYEKLSSDFRHLGDGLDSLTQNASFAGRNLINPDGSAQPGDIELPSEAVIQAHDLRTGQGILPSITPPVKPPFLESLRHTFAFDGSTTPQSYGPPIINQQWFGYPSTFVDGEGGGQALSAMNQRYTITDQDAITVALSLKYNTHLLDFSLRHGSDAISFQTTPSGQLNLHYNGSLVGSAPRETDWFRVAISIDETGATSVFKDGGLVSSFTISNPMTDDEPSISVDFFRGGVFDNVSIHARALSAAEVKQVDASAAAGVENWESDAASSWAQVSAEIGQSLQNLREVQSYYGGIARRMARESAIEQRMADIIDKGVTRLVDRDISKLGALRAAQAVREQLAQAMMQTQTSILSAQTGLFSNALGLFDAMNAGGFRPVGLETAGARTPL